MPVTIPAARDGLKQDYLTAFIAANPGKKPPSLWFERGFWYLAWGLTVRPTGIRTTKLVEMTENLRTRASAPDNPDAIPV